MTVRIVSYWICDKCGHKDGVNEFEIPYRWEIFTIHDEKKHLCPNCADSLTEWVNTDSK
jgi:ribosomal protein L37AE/L43A